MPVCQQPTGLQPAGMQRTKQWRPQGTGSRAAKGPGGPATAGTLPRPGQLQPCRLLARRHVYGGACVGRRLGGVSPPLGTPPQPGNRFVSCVRATRGFGCRGRMAVQKQRVDAFPFSFLPRSLSFFPWIISVPFLLVN